MRVLWFTNTSSLYDQGQHQYHGGGWIESLEILVRDLPDIDLAISFFHAKDNTKRLKNNTTYYPIKSDVQNKNFLQKLSRNLSASVNDKSFELNVNRIIEDFNPDIIHIFGTEGVYSELKIDNIPVVYHIQGLVNPYLATYFPINQSKYSFYFSKEYILKTFTGNSPYFDYLRFKNRAIRENKALKVAKYVMGRTEWDKNVTKLYNPNVKYYHVDEVLRDVFYNKEDIKFENNKIGKLKIISTLSPTIYKGFDVVLKVANELKKLVDFDFEWNIIGITENNSILRHFEKSEGIKYSDNNVKFLGRKSANELIEFIQDSDVYIHPSYIDNSPNSVCEAQMLGIPVIACNVGGVPSLIKHMENGILVPSNGIFEIVHYIKQLKQSPELRKEIGEKGHEYALLRHNKEAILDSLIDVYKRITKKNIK